MTKSNILSNLVNAISGPNESSFSAYDYLYDNIENNNNNNNATNSNFNNGPQHLATILQQLFSKMADNQTTYKSQSNSPLFDSSSSSLFPTSLFSVETVFPSSSSTTMNTKYYHILSYISLWFVLIINPIVVKLNFF
jgi:hypothetical protein